MSETADEAVTRLTQTDMSQLKIAEYLNKHGYKRANGMPYTKKHVSLIAIANGMKRRERKTNAERNALANPATPTVSKWDVLKTIENCTDLSNSAKKALLDLVWREVNK